jgi:uncharacterized membrane protein YfcA
MIESFLASIDLGSVIGWGQVLLIAAVAIAASIITAIAGVGGAIVLSFVLTPILGPAALVQTISVAMLINNMTKVNVYRRGVDWGQGLFVVACAAPGCVLGSLIYSRLDERTITIVLGVFLIGIVVFKWLMPGDMGRRWPKPLVAVSSFVYGTLTGTTIGGGILLLPILMGTGLTGMALIGTDAVCGLAMHIVKTLVFGTTGVLTAQYAAIGVLIGIVMIPGAYIARAILQRMPLKVHERLIDAVIIGGGLSFLAHAVAR